MKLYKYILAALLHWFSYSVLAQDNIPDSLKFQNDFFIIDDVSTSFLVTDTSLDFNQVYVPALRDSYKNVFTGNIGTASFRAYGDTKLNEFIDWGINHFNSYQLDPIKRKINLITKPYSELDYILGSKQEQRLRVIHQQHITKNMIAGLDFITLASDGFYNDQLAKQRALDAFYYFNTRKNVYQLLTSYTSNKNESRENGGLACDTCFENDEGQSVDRGTVNLTDAQSKVKSKVYFLKQRLNVIDKNTSNKTDSINNNTSISFYNTNYYKRKQFVYRDSEPNLDFYNFIYYDSTNTYDSSFVEEINSAIGLEFNKRFTASSDISLNLIYELSNFRLSQNRIDTSITTGNAGIQINYNLVNLFHTGIDVKVGTGESSKSAYSLEVDLLYKIFEKLQVGIDMHQSQSNVPLIYNSFDSNHYNWKNDFNQTKNFGVKGFVNFEDNLKFSIEYDTYDDHIYFDTLALPMQIDEKINVTHIELEHDLNLGNIRYKGSTGYNILNYSNIYPVPDLQFYHSLFYEDRWFKVGMPVQVGFDFRYHTNYFAKAYMPVTGQLYLQNDQEIGNYLFSDFFFNFRIKNSKVFFKVDHFHEGLFYNKRSYWIMPFHPMMGRSFKIGIKWKFLD